MAITEFEKLRIWAPENEIEPQALAQLKNTASLPWVFHHVAAMPDVHYGKGATIGSVIAMKEAVSPAAVGVDIGCGMAAVRMDLTASDLPDSLADLRHEIERSKIPLRKWLWAWYIMCSSKTQVSALQLQRQLELGSYRSAWFMCHRIRFAMKDFGTHTPKMTGTVEADEMYVGGKVKGKGRRYTGNKTAVVSMVERGGRVYSEVMPRVNGREIDFLLKQRVAPEAHLNTDESKLYSRASKRYASHDTVNHGSEEWSRHDAKTGRVATTNTVEGFFGNVKRSLDGTHHQVSRKYLHLYLAEQDHKYNTRKVSDGARTAQGILMAEDKRLMFRGPFKA